MADGECAICMDEMRGGFALPCGHSFPVPCLRKWCLVSATCPTCRASVEALPCFPGGVCMPPTLDFDFTMERRGGAVRVTTAKTGPFVAGDVFLSIDTGRGWEAVTRPSEVRAYILRQFERGGVALLRRVDRRVVVARGATLTMRDGVPWADTKGGGSGAVLAIDDAPVHDRRSFEWARRRGGWWGGWGRRGSREVKLLLRAGGTSTRTQLV